MPPVVPGFITTGEVSTDATGAQWAAVRSLDARRFGLKVVRVADLSEALLLATEQMAGYDRIENRHVVRRHHAIGLADGTLALVLDEVSGGSLAELLGARGQLTAGETVTTLAPLFRALADLHVAGIAHGDLAPGNILFRADGRPMIGELGYGRLLGRVAGRLEGTASGGFVAPEVESGAEPSHGSDVYALAAIGWLCLTGAPPDPVVTRRSLTILRPDVPVRLAQVLTSCLATDPAARPSAGGAALDVFDSAPAESVALASVADPAAEITRRIRASAASASAPAPPGIRSRLRTPLALALVAVLSAVGLGIGTTWFLARTEVAQPVVGPAASKPKLLPATAPTTTPATKPATTPATKPPTQPASGPRKTSLSSTDLMTASNAPRTAASRLVQGLVDARALAYAARNPALLDLVYAPGAKRAEVDRGNIATAVKNGGTYVGLSFVVKGVAFLDGTSDTARVRATIVTPAYETGQPDGRKIPHPLETLGPCVFSLGLTPDGWRVLDLTTP